MTATTLQQTEAAPEGYPEDPYLNMSDEAGAYLVPAWQRIEAWICWRYSSRDVTWIVEGPGDWLPPLKPAEIDTVEEWQGAAWEAVSLDPSPLGGFILKGCGPYRFTATVGADVELPEAVNEAVRRLAEYWAAVGTDRAGLRGENVPGVWQGEYDNRALARAITDSGAADLLRNYRRA